MPIGRYITGIMERHSEKEKAIRRRVSNRIKLLIVKKIFLLERRRKVNSNSQMPVTLLELIQYKTGKKEIPLNRLKQIFEFYGCSDGQMARWNFLICVMIYNQIKKNQV